MGSSGSFNPDADLHQQVRQGLNEVTLTWLQCHSEAASSQVSDDELDELWAAMLQPHLNVDEQQTLWAFALWGSSDLAAFQDQTDDIFTRQTLEDTFLQIVEALPMWALMGRRQQLQNWLCQKTPVHDELPLVPVPDTRVKRPLEPIPDSLAQQNDLLEFQQARVLREVPSVRKGIPVVIEPDGVRCLYILHLFSGRRRERDCHYWTEQLLFSRISCPDVFSGYCSAS